MAMASVVKSILRNRKYPFIFALFLLLIFVTLFLISNSQSQFLISSGVGQPVGNGASSSQSTHSKISGAATFDWNLCNMSWMVDYIPCLDNWEAIKSLKKLERKERHCPNPSSRCLVPLHKGYKIPVPWPKSRDMVRLILLRWCVGDRATQHIHFIWYENVPHPKLVDYKKDQHWVVKSGDYLVFPGGGTQFKLGVNHYIESIEKILPIIEWGKHVRVVLDVGCGVASFGGYLLEKDVITMSFAPKDQHEAQIQFALERGIPATLSVIGTRRLVYPDNVYDMVHCARCRVRWDVDGGKPLLELNRILRPGGFFIWSATPVYLKDEEHQNMWKDMAALTEAICWTLVNKTFIDSLGIGVAIYQKPSSSSCYKSRKEDNPPVCDQNKRSNSSWYVPLDGCLPLLPEVTSDILSNWPAPWPQRLKNTPPSLSTESEENFRKDTEYWSSLVSDVYLRGLDINWSSIRNVMDMNAGYGGLAAAIIDLPLWVMNVVPISEPDTLSIIFDRGLIGMYHNWCESFDTYPRTYDLLHANFLLNKLTQRCSSIVDVVVEIDRVLRPGGVLLVQDNIETINEITAILVSLHWSTSTHQEKFLVGKKGFWRPNSDTTRF